MVLVSAETPELAPPKTPAIHIGLSFPSLIMISEPFSVLSTPSRVVNFVPSFTVPTFTVLSAILSASKACNGWPKP